MLNCIVSHFILKFKKVKNLVEHRKFFPKTLLAFCVNLKWFKPFSKLADFPVNFGDLILEFFFKYFQCLLDVDFLLDHFVRKPEFNEHIKHTTRWALTAVTFLRLEVLFNWMIREMSHSQYVMILQLVVEHASYDWLVERKKFSNSWAQAVLLLVKNFDHCLKVDVIGSSSG